MELDSSRAQRRNLTVLLVAIFFIGCGEELWSRFVPNYLVALGGSVLAVSAFGTLKDLLDAVYQFPGGVLTARLGPKKSLLAFNILALAGYAAVALASRWWIVLLALPLVSAWQSFSLPATFSIVGDSLRKGERSVAFAYPSIVRRVPIIIAPVLGGMLIATFGLLVGMRTAIAIGIALGIVAALIQLMRYRFAVGTQLSLAECINDVTSLDPQLKQLLLADSLVRFGQGIGEVFIVLYATQIVGVSAPTFGWLIGLAMLTSIAVYLPVARNADLRGRGPWVTLTYAFFAIFPLVLALSTTTLMLVVAFTCMGLREIGEPPRKALLVDLARSERRSVDVGSYYFTRGLIVFPASIVGGLLWRVSPHLTFFAAAFVALVGTLVFASTLGRRRNIQPA
ncbi:MAG: MFS transporter [Candidatus Eremiobacteraeota bacterium]|nr:MFS transporter [Candidatus Eremiobacteraeota bacterium]